MPNGAQITKPPSHLWLVRKLGSTWLGSYVARCTGYWEVDSEMAIWVPKIPGERAIWKWCWTNDPRLPQLPSEKIEGFIMKEMVFDCKACFVCLIRLVISSEVFSRWWLWNLIQLNSLNKKMLPSYVNVNVFGFDFIDRLNKCKSTKTLFAIPPLFGGLFLSLFRVYTVPPCPIDLISLIFECF